MPELPEVETVRRDLARHITGLCVTDIKITDYTCIKLPEDKSLFAERMRGRSFVGLSRRGKFLRLLLDDGSSLSVHLRMTGRLIYSAADCPLREHTHIVFSLSDGAELRFSDTRKFGCLWWQAAGEPDRTGAEKLGLEPLDDAFAAEYLCRKLGKRKMPIKSGILEQSSVAGLGNIYADEVLFRTHIQPTREAYTLSDEEWRLLAENMRSVLCDAIENRGTTFSDFLDGEGHIGTNQNFLRVYGKKGQPCPDCGETLVYTKVGGRGTVFCPKCQR